MNPADFLATLWGEQPAGYVELWMRARKHSRYTRNPRDGVVASVDGRADVYTGVTLSLAQYPHNRRAPLQARVALAGFWLDLDVGRGGAPDKAAAREVAGAVREPTIVVDSGNGLHAWHLFETPWRFETKAEQEQAAAAAVGWYALHRAHAQERGWTIDHTHDLARLLRLPGTTNAKDPARVLAVEVAEHGAVRYTRAELLALAAAAPVNAAPVAAPLEVVVTPGAGGVPAKLDALRFNSPEFAAALQHHGRPGWSHSEWDLSIASQAARAGWSAQEIADLIAWHRAQWGTPEKAQRVRYLERTIGMAMSGAERAAA